jgi:hypothetical protein
MRSTKEYSFNGFAGCVIQFKSRATKTLVGIYHGYQSGIEADPEYPWVSVCEVHHTCVAHTTLTDAHRTRDPREFCDDCRGVPPSQSVLEP